MHFIIGNKALVEPLDTAQMTQSGARWFAIGALALLPLAGVVSAITMTTTEDVTASAQMVSERVFLIPGSAVTASPSKSTVVHERIQKGDSISTVLNRMRIEDVDGQRGVVRSVLAKSVGTLVPGHILVAEVDDAARVTSLMHVGDTLQRRWERSQGNELESVPVLNRLESRIQFRTGTITSSFFAATDKADLPDQVASAFADVFSDQIDLRKGIRRGDHFSVVYDQHFLGGHEVGEPRILAAEFVNNGQIYQAVMFRNPATGRDDYFAPTGRNMKKVFLGSPIEFSRVTSGFSAVRLHPVLQVWRAHKGVDFAAPIGTRVKATADGEVKVLGWQNGYGNTVVLQHSKGYSTLYGHLSAFAHGLRQGNKVSQGAVIGYVGMTGVSTGPHLHYEFHVHGVHVDPAVVASRNREDVPAESREAFFEISGDRLRLLAAIRNNAQGDQVARFE